MNQDYNRVQVESCEFANDAITMKVQGQTLRIAPVSLANNPFKGKTLFLKARKVLAPNGPIHYLEFYNGEELFLIVSDNARRNSQFLTDFSISPGKVIGEDQQTKRSWTELEIKTPQQKLIVKPGTMTRLKNNNVTWGLILIGSSLDFSVSKDKAEEIPEFSADFVVYRLK
ncbi:MAG TPA: hypothetical protein VEC37_17700 [Bacillota bacterium]|nr:hypothetical protein [Bacillota bacterium]